MRGEGLLWALDTATLPAAEVVHRARAGGLLLNAARPHCLRFMPRLNSTTEEIDLGLALLAEALAQVQAAQADTGLARA